MLDELLSKAEAAGYDTSELILVEHDRNKGSNRIK
jgi:lipocalin